MATTLSFKGIPLTMSAIGLIFSNLVPLLGVLFLGWSVASVLVVYWLETVIIGVLNIPKLWACDGSKGEKIFLILFFSVHYGMFCAGHLLVLIEVFDVKPELEALRGFGYLWWAAATFVISHTFSMVFNFFGKTEYQNHNLNTQMFLPYGRIVVMHIVVLVGALAVMEFGAPIGAVVLLIVLKTAIDLIAHTRTHRTKEAQKMVD